jgi:hypothetical protein
VSARRVWGLLLMATVAISCTKLKSNRCDNNDDCGGATCNTQTKTCLTDGGAGGTGGLGGIGGAAGKPFSCADITCSGPTPICDMAVGSCQGCSTDTACKGLDSTKPLCVKATDAATGPAKGSCVGCLTDVDCSGSKATPVCSLDTGSCKGCDTQTATACKDLDSARPVCVIGTDAAAGPARGSCVGCLTNADCSSSKTTPICNLMKNSCAACATDLECKDIGPGICMQDGHCAAASEVMFVDESVTCPGLGSSTSPYCSLPTTVPKLAAGTNVIVILGGTNEQLTLATTSVAPVVIGRKNSAGDIGSIPANAGTAISIASDTVLIRDLTVDLGSGASSKGVLVSGASTNLTLRRVTVALGLKGLGVDAESGASLSIDQCYVENNSIGGILVNGATAIIQNSVIAANGGTTGYGIQFNVPGANTQFTINTVVGNQTAAISDFSHPVPLDYSIVVGATTNCPTTTSSLTAPPFSSTNPYHLTAPAPCAMQPTPPFPAYDLDGQPRVAPVDCGADQFVSP